jgi:hypothetical protein
MIRFVWLTLLAVHIGAAGVWWWLMPGGFPGSSTEFWINQVAPPLVVGGLLTALVARGRFSEAILAPMLATIPIFWMAFGVSSRIVFPVSSGSAWNVLFVAGAALTGLWVRQFRFRVRPVWLVPVLAVAAAVAGWTFPGALRAPEPATAPAGAPLGAVPAGATDPKLIRLTKDAQLHPVDGRVVVRRDRIVLNVQPMLSFADRSPDRCWTALAPAEENVATVRTLVSKLHDAAGWSLFYKDEDASVLDVATRDGAIQLDARSRLPRPVFSHVNSFTELTVQGDQKLSVSFSPLPQTRIDIAAATEPARFAYVDEGGTFHVTQASQRQVGPFHEIAAGHLGRGEPLVLTIYDGDKAAFRVTIEDWAAQASTQLSPTAGWGIPVNAIELAGGGDLQSPRALISFSLATTSIGRGTQTVGHAAGVYRNRITLTLPPRN